MNAVPNSPKFMGPSNAGFSGMQFVPMFPARKFGGPEKYAEFLQRERETIAIISQHAYTGGSSKCGDNPKPGFLLQPSSTTEDPTLAEPYVAVTKAAGKPYRMAEMNSIMCSGEPGISDAFEAALWVSDILFEYAQRGIAGVNLHTNIWNTIHGWDIYGAFLFDVPENQYQASNTEAPLPEGASFTNEYSLRKVLPLYYGLLFFAQASSNQGKLLPLTLNTSANMKAWATLDQKTGYVNIAIINKDLKASGKLRITVPGYRFGTVKRMLAPSFSSRKGITIAGQTFDGSKDGKPLGKEYGEMVSLTNGVFEISAGPASAFLLTLYN
jgi:hypothetical protein